MEFCPVVICEVFFGLFFWHRRAACSSRGAASLLCVTPQWSERREILHPPESENMAHMASLILEDGSTFKGLLFGADVSVSGEVGESFSRFLQP